VDIILLIIATIFLKFDISFAVSNIILQIYRTFKFHDFQDFSGPKINNLEATFEEIFPQFVYKYNIMGN
jgi:hypothetical protein